MNGSHYVVLRATTSSLSQQEHLDWCAIARSQIRKFLGRTGDHSAISRVHAWPNAYAVTGPTVVRDSKYMESQWFIGMDFNCNEKDFIADHIKKFEENGKNSKSYNFSDGLLLLIGIFLSSSNHLCC